MTKRPVTPLVARVASTPRYATAAALRLPLPGDAWAPRQIDFGERKAGDEGRASASVTASGDGVVVVRIVGDAPFEIVRVTPFTGRWEGIGVSARPRWGEAQSAAGRERRVTVAAGQEVRVEVRFRAGGVGSFAAKLIVEGDRWGVTIPLRGQATLLGPLVGALVVPESHSLMGIAGATLEVPLQLLSLSARPATVRVAPRDLPTGVSAEPVVAALEAGGRANATLRVRLAESVAEGREMPLRFTVDAGGPARGSLTLWLNAYQPWVEYPFEVRDRTLRARGALQIKSDGAWSLRATVENEMPLLGEKAWMSVVFLGDADAPTGWEEELRLGGGASLRIERSGESPWLKANFARVVAQTGVTVFLMRKARSIPEIVEVFR